MRSEARRKDLFPHVVVLASVFAVAVGYSVVLPFLPALVQGAAAAGQAASPAWHVGGLVAAYSGAALLLSPAWGWLSDRWSRRAVLLVGMAGFAITLALLARDDVLWRLYLYRLLNGAFGAAVTPVAFALVADRSPDALERARRFAWLNALVLAGYLTGPLAGALMATVSTAAALYVPAALVGILGLVAALALPAEPPSTLPTHAARPAPAKAGLARLLAITAAAAGGIAALEVALALAPQGQGLNRPSVSLLLSLCGLVMLVAQVMQFSGRRVVSGAKTLLRPALVISAIAMSAAPLARGLWPLAGVVATAAWSVATLGLLTSYLISQLSARGQGLGLGLQYAAASGGQVAGALAIGLALGEAGRAFVLWSIAAISLGLALSLTTRPRATASD